MKIATDLEQSKKLAEILPLESADMCYRIVAYNPNDTHEYQPYCFRGTLSSDIPCWSLAALFSMLPKSAYLEKGASTELCRLTLPVELITSNWNLEPIDACYEMILKLKEKNLL